MGLKNIKLATYTMEVGEEKISLRGISLSDLMVLADTYGPTLSIAFQRIQQGGLQDKDTRTIIHALSKEFPDVIAAGIALASDEYDEETVEIAKRLPFNKQVEAVEEIFKLTFQSEAEVKKLLESLTKAMAEVSGALTTLRLPSLNGIGESDAA